MKRITLEDWLERNEELRRCKKCERFNDINRAYYVLNSDGKTFYHILYDCGHNVIHHINRKV